MYINELYVKNFRGISEKRVVLNNGVNIISGKSSSGKTSLIDSLLFLQRFSVNPSLTLEHLLNVWFGESIAYKRAKAFEIMIGLKNGGEQTYFGLLVNVSKNRVRETYIIKDTQFVLDEGELIAQNIEGVKNKPKTYNYTGENIWGGIPIRSGKIVFTKLPWRTVAGMIAHETTYYGLDVALERAPPVLAKVLVSRTDLSGEPRELITQRLIDLFRQAFKLHWFFRRSVIMKLIDFKNAAGPTKLRGSVVDPHFSNLPWIVYTMHERGRVKEVYDCLNKLGVNESLAGVSKTVDQRYYLVINSGGRELVREGIPAGFLKLLAICTATCYSDKLVAIDDFDEYLDESITHALFKTMLSYDKQFILTSRRTYDLKYVDERVNIINLQ